jgi:hypothetical protein
MVATYSDNLHEKLYVSSWVLGREVCVCACGVGDVEDRDGMSLMQASGLSNGANTMYTDADLEN